MGIVTKQIQKELRRNSNRKDAVVLLRFFKTGEGEYGDGDRFIGVRMPKIRQIAKKHLSVSLAELSDLIQSPVHEDRMCALVILSEKQKREKEPKFQTENYRFYLKNLKFVNNWDLVDISCSWVVGFYLFEKDRKPLYRLARKKSLWARRVAVVSTHYFIRKGDLSDALKICELSMNAPEDLMHKAVGWTLREIGKRDIRSLRRFLDQNASKLPRTALRYSLERLEPSERLKYMRMGRRHMRRF